MENENRGKLGVALIYALAAALIGGIIWGAIVITLNYELAIIAWGIGGITGYAVVLAAKNHITQAHRLIAVIASLFGIIIGKYIGFAYTFNNGFEKFFSSYTRNSFGQYFGDIFPFIHIIFIVLAVFTAWQIPTKFAKGEPAEEKVQTVLDGEIVKDDSPNQSTARDDSSAHPSKTDDQSNNMS